MTTPAAAVYQVLIVDDSAEDRLSCRRYLSQSELPTYEFSEAETVEALDMLDVIPKMDDGVNPVPSQLADLAAGLDIPLATLALAWCLRRPELTSCIIGATREEQILQNVKASELLLDDDVLETISAILGE